MGLDAFCLSNSPAPNGVKFLLALSSGIFVRMFAMKKILLLVALSFGNCFAGDIIQTEKLHRRNAGEKVTFGTVLLVGGKDFTIIGKPTVPYAKVHCTIEQQTLSQEMISFYYKPRRRMSRYLRTRHWVTMLRVDKIEADPKLTDAALKVEPKRLLDLWANRWLTTKEVEKMKSKPLDIPEHQPGTYQRRGLVDSYRFTPDPLAPKKGYF
jgi:large subunit ribosomal protein L21